MKSSFATKASDAPAKRRRAFAWFVRLAGPALLVALLLRFDARAAYAAMREVRGSTGDELVGVAVWLPLGAFPLSAARQLRALPRVAGVLSAAPARRHRGAASVRGSSSRSWLRPRRWVNSATWRP